MYAEMLFATSGVTKALKGGLPCRIDAIVVSSHRGKIRMVLYQQAATD